jgi:hypothetical protein
MTALTVFFSSLLESLPSLCLGTVISSLLLVWGDSPLKKLGRPNSFVSAAIGSCLGLLLPVGQYGSLPVARRLLLLDFPTSVAIAFLIAAPTLNPIAIWITFSTFADRPHLAWLRLTLTLAIALLVGYLFGFHKQKHSLIETEETIDVQPTSSLLQTGTLILPQTKQGAFNLVIANAIEEFVELGMFLIIGCGAAAIVQTIVHPVEILSIASTPVIGILTAILLATVLSVGSFANSLFISSIAANLTNGSILAFLLVGSIIDLKSLSLMLSSLSSKAVTYIIVLVLQLTFLLCLILDFYVN